jgi:CubicO group peptidase (beta-lactamase class C family)
MGSFKGEKRLEELLVQTMTDASIPGAAVAVIRDNGVVYERAFGARKVADNLPVTLDTLFGIGSCTKSFTALAILQLAAKKKLSLGDPIDHYLPLEFDTGHAPITIRHLLSHSSGLPDLGMAHIILRDMLDLKSLPRIPLCTWEDFYRHAGGCQSEALPPDTRWLYFNSGYSMLGEIIAAVGGQPYEAFIKSSILDPLDMKTSTFDPVGRERELEISTPYVRKAEGGATGLHPSSHLRHPLAYAAGGLLSSAREMARYLLGVINNRDSEGSALLPSKLQTEMMNLYIEHDPRNRSGFGDSGRSGYGYGWAVWENFFGKRVVSHGGSTGVSGANMAFMPEEKVGVVGLNNVGGFPNPVIVAVLALLLGKDPAQDVPYFRRKSHHARLAGSYQSYKGIHRIDVISRGGLLYLESGNPDGRMSTPLVPGSDDPECLEYYEISTFGGREYRYFLIDEAGGIDLFVHRTRYHKMAGKG